MVHKVSITKPHFINTIVRRLTLQVISGANPPDLSTGCWGPRTTFPGGLCWNPGSQENAATLPPWRRRSCSLSVLDEASSEKVDNTGYHCRLYLADLEHTGRQVVNMTPEKAFCHGCTDNYLVACFIWKMCLWFVISG